MCALHWHSLKHGAIIQCVVLVAEGSRIDVSCRHSRLRAAGAGQFEPMHVDTDNDNNTNSNSNTDTAVVVAQDAAPAVGTVVRGFVCGVSRAGCFVRLSRTCTARVLLKDLSDNFVSSPEQEFPIGRLVAGRVLTQDADKGFVSLSLRPSAVTADGSFLRYSTIRKGAHVKGTVKTVSSYGVFIQLDNSEVRGMCHKSEAADHKVEDLTKAYSEGDYVKAIVLKVDIEKRRVSLGLKPSYFIDASSSDDDSDNDSDAADSDSETEDTKHIKQIKHATASKQSAAVGGDDSSDDDNNNECIAVITGATARHSVTIAAHRDHHYMPCLH
eukprot:10793-Heterococcus_DN1.PRE.1